MPWAGISKSASRTRVTVVIPTYNRCHWLAGAIEAVLAQTYRDFQLVVSDNASTDATREVVTRFDDPRVIYIRQDRNLELNEHFNWWYERADTEYLLVAPDDDRLLPGALASTVRVLDANPAAGLVHGQADIIDEHGALIARAHDMTGLDRDSVETGADFIARSMAMSYRVHASTALIRAAAIRTCLLDQRDWPLTDLGQWMRLALEWDVAFIAQPLAQYRVHSGAYSTGGADVTSGGYAQRLERIAKAREVKLRLLAEEQHRIASPRRLALTARRAFRSEALEHAGNATLPDRRPGETWRALVDCAQLDPAVAIEPAAWRLAIGSAIGPRAVAALKRRRRASQRSVEVTA